MNPLTLVKRIQNINSKEASLGISEDASWHAKYKDSAYVYVGGIPFDLTEGDLLAVFAQYGEIVDVNLVRDKGTGKSKGFAFVAYEDQRNNLNGAQILGRTIRVDHVTKYKKKEEEDEEAEQQKREARGVCRAFQRGECTRGAGCRFSHNEQRAANTGWGPQDAKNSKWENDKFQGPTRSERGSGPSNQSAAEKMRTRDKDSRDEDTRRLKPKKDEDLHGHGRKPTKYDSEMNYGEGGDRRKEKRSKHDSESYRREDQESSRRTSQREDQESRRRTSQREDQESDRRSSRHHRRKD
ncbi:zinc finger CCCH domain-containing protein 25 isoform X2 [Cynara cardunculus var. scolymus]|uniref:zinc finger CCCH domain-containing protein 25 isoform X2 n=1 Tax=Cynara cardunculus var. scolymus TaxID=59895 RepID=UPI000D624646|nr:zinc finger CCCH domain-containing protein 25 isoform X2 [Cynara cardunculus var. scolymus]